MYMYSINILMLFLKLFHMTAKCKFAWVKAINTLGMAKPCILLGGFGGMLPRENFVKIR